MSAPTDNRDMAAVLADRRAFLVELQRRERLAREQVQRQKDLIDRDNPGQVTVKSADLARELRDSRLIDSWLGRNIRALPKDGD